MFFVSYGTKEMSKTGNKSGVHSITRRVLLDRIFRLFLEHTVIGRKDESIIGTRQITCCMGKNTEKLVRHNKLMVYATQREKNTETNAKK